MIEFRILDDEEKEKYKDKKFEGALVFDDREELAAVVLAAKARILARRETGSEVTDFDEFVANLDPTTKMIYMHRSTAGCYPNLLDDYNEQGYMYVQDEILREVDACRERAKRLSQDVGLSLRVFDLVSKTDFDAFNQIAASATNPQWDDTEVLRLLDGSSGPSQ